MYRYSSVVQKKESAGANAVRMEKAAGNASRVAQRLEMPADTSATGANDDEEEEALKSSEEIGNAMANVLTGGS